MCSCWLGYFRQPLISLLSPTSWWFSSLIFMMQIPGGCSSVVLRSQTQGCQYSSLLWTAFFFFGHRGSHASRAANSSTNSHLCVASVWATLLIPAGIHWRRSLRTPLAPWMKLSLLPVPATQICAMETNNRHKCVLGEVCIIVSTLLGYQSHFLYHHNSQLLFYFRSVLTIFCAFVCLTI